MIGAPIGSTRTRDCKLVSTAVGCCTIWTRLTRKRSEVACPRARLIEVPSTVEPRYNEVPRYRKNVRYSGVFVITNYLVNNKNIRYSGVTNLNSVIQIT